MKNSKIYINKSVEKTNYDLKFSNHAEELLSLDINIKDLSFNLNDSNISLMAKNKKLSHYVIRLSNKISHLNHNIEELKLNNDREKEEMLNRLETISKNYKIYANSHKKLLSFEKIKNESNQINKIYETYIKLSLNDMINIFNKLEKTSNDDLSSAFESIEIDLKNNIHNYKNILNGDEFKDIFKKIELKERKSIAQKIDDHKQKKKNVSPPIKKDFSDITQLIDINIEKLHNSLYKNDKAKNNSRNFINSSKSYQNNTNKYSKSKSLEMSNDQNSSAIEIPNLKNNKIDKQESRNLSFTPIKEMKNNQNKDKSSNEKNIIQDKEIRKMNESEVKDNFHSENNNKSNSNKNNFDKFLSEDYSILANLKLTAVAIFDFIPTNSNELAFNKGDNLEIEMKEGTGWIGSLNGKTGLIPYNYVRIN